MRPHPIPPNSSPQKLPPTTAGVKRINLLILRKSSHCQNSSRTFQSNLNQPLCLQPRERIMASNSPSDTVTGRALKRPRVGVVARTRARVAIQSKQKTANIGNSNRHLRKSSRLLSTSADNDAQPERPTATRRFSARPAGPTAIQHPHNHQ